jgi:feruloyl esterase
MKLIVCAVVLTAPVIAATTCESLSSLKVANTTITAAQTVPAGGFVPAGGPADGGPGFDYKKLPAFCRVQGVIAPSADSHIEFEVWMPDPKGTPGWNGRYEGLGNGGFAGTIGYSGMADAVANGYAASGTDTGHKGNALNATWALNHPEKITDFGYRAIHNTAENAKAIIAAFYGNRARHSYFSSCSNGGREALMEAQRFPEDYDGILAGAPANYWTHLLSVAGSEDVFLNDPAGRIPPSKLPAIQAAVLAACDAQDGVKDGVLNDPASCRFDPTELLCKGADSDSCLTAPQTASLQKLYQGPHDSSGKLVFPGHMPGAEAAPGSWALWITGARPAASLEYGFGTGFFSNMVLDNASWDYRTFQLDHDLKLADDKLARTLNSTDPDLKRFKDRGGKLVIYHGWNDPAISPLNSIDYLHSVQAKMGAKQTDSFVRLYLVPGMLHCAGGPGPDSFGQNGLDSAEPDHSVSKALERWVENRQAPGSIIATRFKTDGNPASGVERTRPLCPYPQVAQYSGSGSTDDAANFKCAMP